MFLYENHKLREYSKEKRIDEVISLIDNSGRIRSGDVWKLSYHGKTRRSRESENPVLNQKTCFLDSRSGL
jgi:hypothetical protein